jgi:hypothetical protein
MHFDGMCRSRYEKGGGFVNSRVRVPVSVSFPSLVSQMVFADVSALAW